MAQPRSEAASRSRLGNRQHRAQLAKAPRRGALQPARLHQQPGPPQFWMVEAFDDDLGSARQAGQRIEIARVKNEDAGDQLVEAQSATAIEGQLVDR